MTIKNIKLDAKLVSYINRVGYKENPILTKLRLETAKLGSVSRMQISPDQGALMSILVRIIGVKRYLEIGVFTGYSSLAVALSMPSDGCLVLLDKNKEFSEIAKRFWKEANVHERITLKLAPALESLRKMVNDPKQELFDLIFVDADKENYSLYYEISLKLLRKGGLIVVDNVLWKGKVTDLLDRSKDTISIREFNHHVYHDKRVESCIIPIADGLTFCTKK